MTTEDKVFRKLKETPEIFCIADDFCKVFDAQMAKYSFKAERKRKYHHESWFFGFKLHLICNEKGELLNFMITPGDVDDRKPLEYKAFVEFINGKLVGDKGYIGKHLFERLFLVPPGCERPVIGIGRAGVLPSCALPRMEAVVEPSSVTEVLFEMVDGNDTHLARKTVADLLHDVVFGSFDDFFYVFCIHE